MIKKTSVVLMSFLMITLLQGNLLYAAQTTKEERIEKIRLVWEPVPNAVMYQLVVTKGKEAQSQVITTKDEIYTNGYELDMALLNLNRDPLHWKVRALDIHARPLTEFTEPQPLQKGEINPRRPLATTQFDQLPYAKIYPVYSWIPVLKANEYELQVFFDADNDPATPDKLIKTDFILGQSSFDYYDDRAYVEAGSYWWRIRAKNAAFKPISEWSEPSRFKVQHHGIRVAALGDSITHGGGAVSTPPSYVMYDWQTYTGLPILNLGLSGDTVERMVDRFDRDVLPFRPKVLVILGGINNLRLGDSAAQVTLGLNRLKYKCLFNRITPVFVTVAPINPLAMKNVSNIIAVTGWLKEQELVNQWIKQQPHHVDITPDMTTKNGWLKSELSVDGLHPDVEGKRIIGQAVSMYLKEHFAHTLTEK